MSATTRKPAWPKRLRIVADIRRQVRLRGLDPDELGLTAWALEACLATRTESELDEIIERAGVP